MNYHPEHINPLITAEEIAKRVKELGRQITADYRDKPLTAVGILKGSFPFMADLIRHIDLPVTCDFLEVSSYAGGTRSTGVVRFNKDLTHPIEGRDVLLIEDIVDSGLTLTYLLRNLETRNPSSLRICALLDKKEAREADVPIEYCGFVIPKKFVVGYGLDFDERYRNLPYVGVPDIPAEEL